MSDAPERIWANVELSDENDKPLMGEWNSCDVGADDDTVYIRLDLHEAEVARLRADLRHVIDERDRTFALMLARAEKTEAELDALCADELVNSLYAIRDAHPTGESYSHMTDGAWREAFRDLQRLARVTLASYRARIGKGE